MVYWTSLHSQSHPLHHPTVLLLDLLILVTDLSLPRKTTHLDATLMIMMGISSDIDVWPESNKGAV